MATAHVKGLAHEFTPEEARAAGRKGGEVVAKNPEHMAAIGRLGGLARGGHGRIPDRSIGSQGCAERQHGLTAREPQGSEKSLAESIVVAEHDQVG